MDYRVQQRKTTVLNKKRIQAKNAPKTVKKSDFVNDELMSRIKDFLKKEYKLGECHIVSKVEQKEIDIRSLKNGLASIRIN